MTLAELHHIPNVIQILTWTHSHMQTIDTLYRKAFPN